MRNELEEKLGYPIPDDLHELLQGDADKYCGLEFVSVNIYGYKSPELMGSFSTYKTFWKHNQYREVLEEFQEDDEQEESYVQSEYLYIIGDANGFSGSVCMALHGIHKGKIYFADNGDDGIIFQADTLQDFLNSLYSHDENICNYKDLKQAVVEKDLTSLKNLIENEGGNLILQRSSFNDRALFDLAYKNKDFAILNYLMSKGFYGFDSAKELGIYPISSEKKQNKLAMAGCLAQYAKPELINQENKLMDKGLNEELMEKYFVN